MSRSTRKEHQLEGMLRSVRLPLSCRTTAHAHVKIFFHKWLARPEKPGYHFFLGNNGAIAQLGERLHGMQEVSGSIPLGSTKSGH